MANRKEKIRELFQALITDADERISKSIEAKSPHYDRFELWKTMSLNAIEQVFGQGHQNFTDFSSIRFSPNQPTDNPIVEALHHIVGLRVAKEKLTAMLVIAEIFIEDEPQHNTTYPVIFISYGGKGAKLAQKLKEFLRILGAAPLDVMDLPNMGASVGEKVQTHMDACTCGIAIISAEDELKSGEVRGRPNIDHEIGMMTKCASIGNRIIVLKENQVTLPSNFRERAYVPFSRSAFSEVYPDIVKELRGFGFF